MANLAANPADSILKYPSSLLTSWSSHLLLPLWSPFLILIPYSLFPTWEPEDSVKI